MGSAAPPAAPAVLVATMLHAPVLGDLVERPRLVEALSSAPQRLKIVRAPAGWGKTTCWPRPAPRSRPTCWSTFRKLDASGRPEAVARARERGLI